VHLPQVGNPGVNHNAPAQSSLPGRCAKTISPDVRHWHTCVESDDRKTSIWLRFLQVHHVPTPVVFIISHTLSLWFLIYSFSTVL